MLIHGFKSLHAVKDKIVAVFSRADHALIQWSYRCGDLVYYYVHLFAEGLGCAVYTDRRTVRIDIRKLVAHYYDLIRSFDYLTKGMRLNAGLNSCILLGHLALAAIVGYVVRRLYNRLVSLHIRNSYYTIRLPVRHLYLRSRTSRFRYLLS